MGERVFVFVGDMTAETGVFMEAWKYALYNDLPITFIVEDNGLSTDTPTQEVWGKKRSEFDFAQTDFPREVDKIIYYNYKRIYPHYGCGVFVEFKDEELKQDGSRF